MGFSKAKLKIEENTKSEYFERTTASLLQREHNNKIEEKNKKTKTSLKNTTKPMKKSPKN